MNELPYSLDFYELESDSDRLSIHLLGCLHFSLNGVRNGAIGKKVPLFATDGTKLIIGSNNDFPDDIKPRLMSSKCQHD
jgi:hypothetical protein